MVRRKWYPSIDWDEHEKIRAALTDVFKDLRKAGYLARMNFSCCSNCAGYDLATKATEIKDKGKEVAGCVFFHRQDQQSWNDGNGLFIRYGSLSTQKYGDIGKDSKVVGKEVSDLLTTYSIPHEWNGNPDECIYILPE